MIKNFLLITKSILVYYEISLLVMENLQDIIDQIYEKEIELMMVIEYFQYLFYSLKVYDDLLIKYLENDNLHSLILSYSTTNY